MGEVAGDQSVCLCPLLTPASTLAQFMIRESSNADPYIIFEYGAYQ